VNILNGQTYNHRWRLGEAAKTVPCTVQPSHLWDGESGRDANAIARKYCATECQFRRDCYLSSLSAGDVGVVRGGILLMGRTRMKNCQRCGLPAVRAGRARLRNLCAVCVCIWDCHGCGKRFYVERRNEPQDHRQYCSDACRIEHYAKRIQWTRALSRTTRKALTRGVHPQ
jgi:hypothetical protein